MTSRVTRANRDFMGSPGTSSIVPLIFTMLSQEYPAAVMNARLALIEFDSMLIDVTDDEVPSDVMKYVYGRYWNTFAREIGPFFIGISCVPFRFVNETFVFEGKSYTMTVPVALERGGFNISAYEDENRRKAYSVYPFNGNSRSLNLSMYDGKDPIYVLESKYRKGISTYSQSSIDSDGGLLIGKWLETNELRLAASKLVGLMTTPPIYIQKHQVSAFSDSAVESARHTDLLGLGSASSGADSLLIGPSASISRNLEINTTLLPEGHILAPHQPPRPDPRLLDYYTNKEAEFKELVDIVMKMHFQIIKADTGGLHSRSEAAVAEARSSTSAHIGELVADIVSAIQTVFGIIYPDRISAVNVVLPCRALATVDILWDMYANEMAPHSLVAEELAKMMNIDKSKLMMKNSNNNGHPLIVQRRKHNATQKETTEHGDMKKNTDGKKEVETPGEEEEEEESDNKQKRKRISD